MISTILTPPSEPQEEIADLYEQFSDGVQQVLRNRELSDQDKKNIENIAEIINRIASTYSETASQSHELVSTRNKEASDQLQYAIEILLPLKEKEFHLAHEQLRQLQEVAEVFDMTLSQKNPEKVSQHKKVSLKAKHPQFIGREDILNEIQTKFNALPPKPIVLYGPPGMGKSETAIAYANAHYEKYTVIWTIAAETEETRECSYKALAEALNLPILKEDTPEDIKKRVHHKLEQFEEIRWLLIYDNLEEPISFPDRGGDILITSRSKEPFLLADTIEITPLSESESITLLKQVTREEESEKMHQLSERLGYYPLVLGQAANYIRLNPGVTIASYLETTPELDVRRLEPSTRYEATLQSVFDHVREALPPLALEWLQVCAYLNADSVSKDYLQTWLETQKECSDASAAQKILTVLVNRGLLRFDPANQTFSMHRLFQEILKCDEKFIEAAKLLLHKFSTFSFHFFVDWETRKKEADEWILHGQKILNSSAFSTLDKESQASIMFNIGDWLSFNGKYKEAHKLFKRSLAIREKTFGNDHPDFADSLSEVANCLYAQGKYKEALEFFKRTLAIRKKAFRDDHPTYADSLSFVADCLYAQGKYEEALDLYIQALTIRERALGAGHSAYAASISNVANCLYAQGKYEEAYELYNPALAIKERALGADHPSYARSISYVANCLYAQGKYEEAHKLHSQALAIRENTFGNDHPDFANSLHEVARCLYTQEKYKEAYEWHSQALAIREKVLGNDHPAFADSLHEVAHCLYEQEKYKEAKQKFLKAYQISKNALGENHQTTQTYLKYAKVKCKSKRGIMHS